MAQEGYGIVVKDAQGNMYFLRPEVLQAAKVPREEAENVQRLLDAHRSEVSGFAESLSTLGTLKIGGSGISATGDMAKTSTYMCPW